MPLHHVLPDMQSRHPSKLILLHKYQARRKKWNQSTWYLITSNYCKSWSSILITFFILNVSPRWQVQVVRVEATVYLYLFLYFILFFWANKALKYNVFTHQWKCTKHSNLRRTCSSTSKGSSWLLRWLHAGVFTNLQIRIFIGMNCEFFF